MASEIKVDTISEKTSAGGVTIDGLLIKDGGISGDVSLIGTTPTFTIGDAGAEDAALVFDGNAKDFYIALDDSADKLVIGEGSTVGTNSILTITDDSVTIGDAAAVDTKIVFDGNAQDYYIALDDSADDLLIGKGSTVGTTPAISIDSDLKVNIPVTTASTSASTGSLITGGGMGVGADLYVGDDTYLITDSAVLGFGADKDTTLTHTDGTGLTLNSTNKLCFNDASQFIQGSSGTVLSIGATDEIDLTATAVDLNGTLNVSGVATFQSTPVFPDGSLALADLDIDGGTDIGAAIVDADLFIVDDGAGGTNRKVAASRLKTYAESGKILQVVQAAITTASTHNTVSTYTASSVLGAITPTAASSKIFISFFWLGAILNNSATVCGGSAKIYQDIDSGGYAALYPSAVGGTQLRITGASGDLGARAYQTITFLDAPTYDLTDVITYKLYAAAGPSGWGNYYVCPDGDSASVILMEVAA